MSRWWLSCFTLSLLNGDTMTIAAIPRYYVRLVRPHSLKKGDVVMLKREELIAHVLYRPFRQTNWLVVNVDSVERFGSHILINWSYVERRMDKDSGLMKPHTVRGATKYHAFDDYAGRVLGWIEGTEKEQRIYREKQKARIAEIQRTHYIGTARRYDDA